MPDPRSAMKEFRYLDQKRVAQGLTGEEEARYAELRDLVGPELPSTGARGGFDVNAAAARLRESLLPAGLRNRPPPTPEPSPEPVAEIAPEPSAADALAAAWESQPFTPVAPAEQPAEPFFDPGMLGLDAPEPAPEPAAWDAAAAGYDPNAYDPNAAAAWDPNAGWDPNAAPVEGAEAAAVDPNAPAFDPNAPAWDPNAYDPNVAAGWDPNAAAWDPNAAAVEGGEAAAYDPNAPAFDPNAPAWDPNAYDPNAAAGWDPNAAAWDPNAAPVEGAEAAPVDPNAPAWDPNAYDPNAAAAWDPNAAAAWDPNAAPVEGGEPSAYDPGAPTAALDEASGAPVDPAIVPYDASGAEPAAEPIEEAISLDAGEWEDAAAAPEAALDPALGNVHLPVDAVEDLDRTTGEVALAAGADAAPPSDPGAWDAAWAAAPVDPAAPPEAAALAAGWAAPGTEDLSAAYDAAAWDQPGPVLPMAPDHEPADAAWAEPPAVVAEDAAPAASLPALALEGDPSTPDAWAPAAQPALEAAPEGYDAATPVTLDAAAAGLPHGDYDELEPVPLEPGEELGLEEAAAVPGWDAPAEAPADPDLVAATVPGGAYDDTAGFTGALGEPPLEDLPGDAPGFRAGAGIADWAPDAALDQGFQLESGGSFDAAADAAAPEWAAASGTPPWEAAIAEAPPLDLGEAAPATAEPAFAAPEWSAAGEVSDAPSPLDLEPLGGELAPEEPDAPLADGGPAPELDFSAPDLSAGLEEDEAPWSPPPAASAFAPEPPLEDLAAPPPLDLALEGEPAAPEQAPEASPEAAALDAVAWADLGQPATDATWDADAAPVEASAPAEALAGDWQEPSPGAWDPNAQPEAGAWDPNAAAELAAADPAAAEPAAWDDAAVDPATAAEPAAYAPAPAEGYDAASVEAAWEAAAAAAAAAPPGSGSWLGSPGTAPGAAPGEAAPYEAAPEAPPAYEAVPPEESFEVALGDGAAVPAESLEDLPTIEVADILEEIPPDEAPPPASLDFEPLPPAALATPEAVPALDAQPDWVAAAVAGLPDEPAAPAAPAFEPAPAPPHEVTYEAVPAPLPDPLDVPHAAAVAAPLDSLDAPLDVPLLEEPVTASAGIVIPGTHRVVVHTLEGQVKRGVLTDADLAAPQLELGPQAGSAPETVASDHVKAIFFMLAAGEQPAAPEGRKVRVAFRDGRQVAGFSPDYAEGAPGFFVIPADARTNTARIWVYQAAVRTVTVS